MKTVDSALCELPRVTKDTVNGMRMQTFLRFLVHSIELGLCKNLTDRKPESIKPSVYAWLDTTRGQSQFCSLADPTLLVTEWNNDAAPSNSSSYPSLLSFLNRMLRSYSYTCSVSKAIHLHAQESRGDAAIGSHNNVLIISNEIYCHYKTRQQKS